MSSVRVDSAPWIGRRQKGLFAVGSYNFGDEIIRMDVRCLRTMTEEEWNETWRKEDKKHDAAVIYEVGKDKTAYTDWLINGSKPIWYYLNHSKSPNVRMILTDGVIAWIARKHISDGDEITIRYNNVPKKWN